MNSTSADKEREREREGERAAEEEEISGRRKERISQRMKMKMEEGEENCWITAKRRSHQSTPDTRGKRRGGTTRDEERERITREANATSVSLPETRW